MEGKTIIAVIVAGVSYLAINKWIWTPMKDDNDPASPSSSPPRPPPKLEYDVFLSFRGDDTRKGITSDLYHRLQRRGIKTFMDDPNLEVGDALSPTLIAAIEQSRFAIVVLSRDYASSTWCLEELAKICECMEDDRRILPLFYQVDPADVRYQKGSFKDAFTKHVKSGRHKSEKVEEWKAALYKVANIAGWNTNDHKTHQELIDSIVESVSRKVLPAAIELMGEFEEFQATRQAMDEVTKALKDDKVNAVGVYGMGGVGKTTMVKHVGAQACKNGIFHHVIMAVVSQYPNFEKLQDTLAEQLGFKFWEGTEIARINRLNTEIMRREKLLIILDDVWGTIELSKIGIPIYKELQKCKSKVVLTTRRLNVCHAMGSEAKIQLSILSEEDAWNLFLNKARRSFESTTFEGVARKVAGECRGLPIALIAVARALGDKDLEEWQKAARKLEESQIANPDHEEVAFECIKLSYDYLKHEDYKSCFLLCCLFPEDSDIPIEDLFMYAIGKGLFRDTETIYEARGIANSVVKYLKDSSLLMDGEENGCVRMHDVIRDTAMNIAKSEDGHGFLVKAGSGLKDWRPCGSHQGYSAISLMKNKIQRLPEGLVCPKLQILLLHENDDLNEIPEKFIRSADELRVLDLSNTGFSLLSQSFTLLTNLQALYLDFCPKIIDISILGKLTKLEILRMREYPLTELSREIGYLTNLRMLDVGGCGRCLGILTIPSTLISKLLRLEELYMLECGFTRWGAEFDEEGGTNIGFDELAGLPNLKNLQVSIVEAECIPENVEVQPNWVYFDIHIRGERMGRYNRPDRNSRSLVLHETPISTLPDWFVSAVITKTEKLEYYCLKGMLGNILMEYDYGRSHGLKHLTIRGLEKIIEDYRHLHENLEVFMNTTRWVQKGPVFENLEELHLTDLDYLKVLFVGELPPRSLINLKVLHLAQCFNLENVPKFLQRLPNLEKLHLDCLHKLECVFGSEGYELEQSKLRVMHLLGPTSVKNICNGPAPHGMFPSIKILTITYCAQLQSLFASDAAQCLVQLEDLFVDHCNLLERVIEAAKNEKTVLPKLKNLVLSNLPKLYGASGTADIECPSLEHLIVVDCPQFSFSEPFHLFHDFGRRKFSFSTSASDYFGSRNLVKLNDEQVYTFLSNSCCECDRKTRFF
ncbi:probable disease resistance protein At4g27220 [Rosa chinensis]|uniref:probable disease resistance protein At4g27220 n=1 Tax=Rosa chinensis TaxID=74649 RepID=UPI000D0903B5|nr:probable disease resistance protein At4g27220 [Rosa chinensis]